MSITEKTETAVPPLRVIVAEMDRAKKIAEQALRTHDAFALELGFDRVYAHEIVVGDCIVGSDGDYEVTAIQPYTYECDEFRRVTLVRQGSVHVQTDRYDDWDLVSRRRPNDSDCFGF